MAIPWFVVLQSIPWSEVIKNAPRVAESAKNLWNTISRKPAVSAMAAHAEATIHEAIGMLQSRVAALEESSAQLHEQMLVSSELLKALAEQNSQLVKRIEIYRLWILGMLVAVVGMFIIETL